MRSDKPIHYEPHPVSPERKAELIAQGFRILDVKFRPAGAAIVAERTGPMRTELDAALARLPDDHTDPEYVVNGMRGHFGDLFTADDEETVRRLVKPTAEPASEQQPAEAAADSTPAAAVQEQSPAKAPQKSKSRG